MSGESTRQPHEVHEALERVFGDRTRCSACVEERTDYRVLTLFLHDHAVVRAYCPGCYEDAVDGEYAARGESLVLDFDAFVARFGCPGPRPRPSAVDRALLALVRDPGLTGLSPASECFARRRGAAPYRVTASYRDGAGEITASFVVAADGSARGFDAHPEARRRVERALGGARRD